MVSEIDFQVAKEKAIRYIGISKKTAYEVKRKLTTLKINSEIIGEVISYLTNLGYIDDEEYTILYIKQNIKFQKYSLYEIRQKLLSKGISNDLIDKHINLLYNIQYDQELKQKLLNTKLKGLDEVKAQAYLYRRGLKNYE
jgi:regulatory protein